MPPKVPKLKTEESTNADATWRSRFPVARIKKIMQADEDVGKVAQVVPVIISKSLELFMASMVKEASMRATETGHKRILPGHMKLAVKGNAMYDFLEPMVEKVPDPVNVQAKLLEEKKMRRGRPKRTTDDMESGDLQTQQEEDDQHHYPGAVETTSRPSASPSHAESSHVNSHQHKKVRSEDTKDERKSASRTMSIANMMSNDDE